MMVSEFWIMKSKFKELVSEDDIQITLDTIVVWNSAVDSARMVKETDRARILELAMEIKVGDVSCDFGAVKCHGRAGHYDWHGKVHYRGLYLVSNEEDSE